MYTIQAFARRCGVSVDRLRHYEKMGLIAPHRDAANGYRYYSDDQLLDVQMICYFQSYGIQLKDMTSDKENCTPDALEALIACRADKVREEIAQMQSMLRILEMIRSSIPEMTSEYGDVRSVEIVPRYTLYYDRPHASQAAVEEWMRHMPFVCSTFVIKTEAFRSNHEPLPIALALQIARRQAERIDIGYLHEAEQTQERQGIRYVAVMRDPMHPTKRDFEPMLHYMEEQGVEPDGD